MRTETREKIVKLLLKRGQVTAKELADWLRISRQGLFLQLNKLLREGRIAKMGKPPTVYYYVPQVKKLSIDVSLDRQSIDFINERYLYVSPLGEKLAGVEGFKEWCRKNKLDVVKTSREYVITQEKYDKWVKDGVISGMEKLKRTFPKIYLDRLYYLDFYSIERFGKTKLGQLLLYAKQSQNREVIRELVTGVRPRIIELIKRNQVKSVGFIPPTVRREVQLMKELEKELRLPLRKIRIKKLKTEMIIPQKTLVRLQDRVENAARTIMIETDEKYNNILLIDDAVGSGATLNETAKQIRERNMVKGKIIGLAIVGSFKGFDVISEV